ncbi:AraC family transcriptional regulator [Kineosporia succinea]|uniref:AraC-like DNA-binding protein n=1 Tax=Kineosporia succinea TaxID=84632 RepID=A0ABT9PFE9_9ACTN|nr:AraC family transcriptional regulator [Kineosporia succinea]MDP9831119.1 AraC-like DNA-binding protein [Kineosporia succinea]
MQAGKLYASTGDPLTDVIRLLRPRTVIDPAVRTAGPWAARFEPFPHVKVGGVVHGACWLVLDGDDHDPVRLSAGDFYLLGNPPPYLLATGLGAEPMTAQQLWDRREPATGTVRIGSEADEDTHLFQGLFSFDEANSPLLLDHLPPLTVVRADDPGGEILTHITALMLAEARAATVSGPLVQQHLAQILLVHMLRAHAENTRPRRRSGPDPAGDAAGLVTGPRPGRPAGWLAALNDDGVGAALRAVHADVSHRWTLGELAAVGHRSRTSFVEAFRRQVGTTPLEYVIQWRMLLARDALRHGTHTIGELAALIGYESESSFSTAFRRVTGHSPRQFRDREGDHEVTRRQPPTR